jgi:hypothetical protein
LGEGLHREPAFHLEAAEIEAHRVLTFESLDPGSPAKVAHKIGGLPDATSLHQMVGKCEQNFYTDI